MKELVVISGKGGTGKTSIVASFAALARDKVLADCDVDAADLHLVLNPEVERSEEFKAGKQARVIPDKCAACGRCLELCAFEAVSFDGPGTEAVAKTCRIDPVACEGCGVCAHFCPAAAIELEEVVAGQWFVSRTRFGPLVHARLGVAEENSGKLVSLVRSQARRLAAEKGLDLVVIDGPPGIGCPVIASITGASLVLVVTEPTLSALHDLERVRQLTGHFGIPTAVCINKYDLNERLSRRIERIAAGLDARVIGKVRYDNAVTRAQLMRSSVVEYTGGLVSSQIGELWREVVCALG
ncbi:MAG: ATP-binding protein [Candidatus Glassbacteria bacterium]|nr:ATP-binding protein [Candidatus Glassbacteria bacterium]